MTGARLFAVAGNPALHSKSPLLFAGAYPGREEFAYFRLAARSGAEALQLFRELGLSGMNVTAPFKEEVAALVARRSPEVALLGAANTVVDDGGGEPLAYNTDVAGVRGALEAAGVEARDKSCLVLGAGGAGRAAALALKQAGGRVTVANRTGGRAREVAALVGCASAGFGEGFPALASGADIIVNALPPGASVLEEGWLTPRHVVLDAVYHAPVLQGMAARRGATYVDGGAWLVRQGIPAYRLFTGEEPDARGMELALARQPALPAHVSFIGFMGAGKSTVARVAAGMLGMPAFDTDREVERRAGRPVAALVAEDEARFRALELEVTRELLESPSPSVISCGGGAVLDPAARRLLRGRSVVAWLHAPPALCASRINVATRPLLARHADPVAAAARLFNERKALYAETAWLLVNTGGRAPKQVSQIVYDEISKCVRG
jgi:shikimate dehydrogenase